MSEPFQFPEPPPPSPADAPPPETPVAPPPSSPPRVDLEQLRSDDLENLARLDANGLVAGEDETFEAYHRRLLERQRAFDDFEAELAEKRELVVFESVTVRAEDRIPDEIIAESAEVTEELYAFSVRSFPGFFLSKDVGLLWGGCLITDTELPLALFLIRGAFRHHHRFLIYGRRELIAHELCHSARQHLHDFYLEEFFAYQTSPSRLRRYLGNCFIRQRDALYFTIPALLLMAVEILRIALAMTIPVWPLWLLLLGATGYLLGRNQLARRQVARARQKLEQFGVRRPLAVLFRTTAAERKSIARMINNAAFTAWVEEQAATGVRWQVIRHRFLGS